MPKEIARAVPRVRVVVSGQEKVAVSPVSVGGRGDEARQSCRHSLMLLRMGKKDGRKHSTYMYVMLLRRLACRVSGWNLNSHITLPQLKAANTGHDRVLTSASCCSFRPKMPLPPCPPYAPPMRVLSPGGSTASFANPSTTLANTYMTICWLTLLKPALPCPKTQYPPNRPAMNECTLFSFPLTFFMASIEDLYRKANLARLKACNLVALKMAKSFSRTVPERKRKIITRACGKRTLTP